jgi:hypothetical protein
MTGAGRVLMIALMVPVLVSCKREVRELRTDPPVADALDRVTPMPNRINGAQPG